MLKHKTQDACQMQKPYLDPDSSEPTVKRHLWYKSRRFEYELIRLN